MGVWPCLNLCRCLLRDQTFRHGETLIPDTLEQTPESMSECLISELAKPEIR